MVFVLCSCLSFFIPLLHVLSWALLTFLILYFCASRTFSNWAQINEGRKYNGRKGSGVYSCYLSTDNFSGLTKDVHISVDLKQDFEQKNGLSPGYCRAEGYKYVRKQMLHFNSLCMHNIFSTRSDNLDADWQRMVNKARF